MSEMVSQEKWQNSQNLIKELRRMLEKRNNIKISRLESIRGFLIYMVKNY